MITMATDQRVAAQWNKAISTKYLGELYAKAYYALSDLVRSEMTDQISKSKSAKETLEIIQRFVRFE